LSDAKPNAKHVLARLCVGFRVAQPNLPFRLGDIARNLQLQSPRRAAPARLCSFISSRPLEGRRGQPSGWTRNLNGSLTAARARRYYGYGPPLIRVVVPAGAWALPPRLCRRHEPGLPAHLSQQVGRTVTPGHGTVIPTAQPAYLRESAIPRGFPRRRNPLSQRKRAGLEPRVPPGRSDGGEDKGGEVGGDKFFIRPIISLKPS
jgi:hypothetical protein